MKHKYLNYFNTFLFGFFLLNQAFAQLEFIENKGQWPGSFGMRAKLNQGDFWLANNEVAFVFSDFGQTEKHGNHAHGGNIDEVKNHCYKMSFVGASFKSPNQIF